MATIHTLGALAARYLPRPKKEGGDDHLCVRIFGRVAICTIYRNDVYGRRKIDFRKMKTEANQSSQRNAMARPVSVFESRSSRG